MAISSDICATAYQGNGSTETPYPINWFFIEPAHVKVRVRDVSGEEPGEWDELNQPADYTVHLWEDEVEEIDFNPRVITGEAWSNAYQVVVYRQTPVLQPIVFPISGIFPAKANELGHDRAILILQEFIRDFLGSAGMEVLFGNPWWAGSQGTPFVLGKPFESVSIGGNGAPDQGKAAVFDSFGGLSLMSATLMNVRRIGFHPDVFAGVSETRSLVAGDNGKVLYYTGSPPITLTAGSDLADGFSCKIVQEGTGQITVDVADLDLRHPDGHTKTRNQWSAVYISRRGSNLMLEGDTAT